MTPPHRIVLLGPPGAGKGTQAARLARDLGIPHISTGDMMRATIASGSDLGRRVRDFVESGRLVPDDLIIDVVRSRLGEGDCVRGFLLDGFPRTRKQAQALDRLLGEIGARLTHVLELVVPEAELKQRLLARARTEGRADDTEAVVEERMRVYQEETRPVSDYYGNDGRLRAVDGVGSIDEVAGRLRRALEEAGTGP